MTATRTPATEADGRAGWLLTVRLAARLAVVIVVAIVIVAGLLGWRAIRLLHSIDDAALQAQAQVVAGYVTTDASGAPQLDLPAAVREQLGDGDAGDGNALYMVLDGANRPLIASDAATAASVARYLPRASRSGLFQTPALPGHPKGLVGAVAAVGPWRVAVADGHEPREALADSLADDFVANAALLLLPVGLVAILIAVLTVREALRPLRLASAAARLVGPDQPGMRLPIAGLPGELRPLVATVNEALDRLEAGLATQRRFTDDAAHALRTPLAVLTARLDALPAGAEQDSCRSDARRVGRIVDQMLKFARLEGLPVDVSALVELRAVALAAISDLAPLALRRGLALSLVDTAPGLRVPGNRELLVMALTNLIENAIAHAPPDSDVVVELAPPALLRVLDRGPGVAPAERALIFQRFHRAGGRQPDGAGLGLAIVAGIAAAHGGAVSVRTRGDGGACFELALPARPPAHPPAGEPGGERLPGRVALAS